MPEGHDPTFAPDRHYEKAHAQLRKLSDEELSALVGAIVGERVNRGDDHETALETVQDAAHGGVEGSRLFDTVDAP